jgi:hypothetical protein
MVSITTYYGFKEAIMAEKIYEKVSEKVQERIKEDAEKTFTPVIERIVKDLNDKGFRKNDVMPYVDDGFYDAFKKVRNS